MPCYWVNFHRLKSYPLISKPHVFKDEIIRLNSIQDERVFSCCLFKGRCYSMSDAGISKNQRKKTLMHWHCSLHFYWWSRRLQTMKNCGRYVDMMIEVKEYVVQWMIQNARWKKIASAPNVNQTYDLPVTTHPLTTEGSRKLMAS